MILVGISGKRRSGKTFLANTLAANYGYVHVSLAAALKDICKDLFHLYEDEVNGSSKEIKCIAYSHTPRQIMIETGKFFRSIAPNYWIDRLQFQLQDQAGRVVISDIRFKNEADWVKQQGGYLIRLERAVELTGEPIDDPSETELDDYDGFDLRIPESSNVDAVDMKEIAHKVAMNVNFWNEQRISNV